MTGDAHRESRDRLKLDLVLLAGSLLLGGVTVIVIQAPARATMGNSMAAQMVVTTVMTLGSWLLAVLAWLRFRELRTVSLQYQGAAFATLGFVNLYFLAVAVQEAAEPVRNDASPAAILAFSLARLGLGVLLLAGGLAVLRRADRISGLSRAALLFGPALFLLLLGLGAAFPDIWRSPEGNPIIKFAARNDPLAAILVHLPIGLVFFVGSIVYRKVYALERQAADAALSVGLLVAAFAQVHFAIEPGGYTARITSEEVLRMSMYLVLVAGVAVQAGADVRRIVRADRQLEQLRKTELERKALEDRERLAHEIHDGIAQDLWLTKLAYGQLRAQLPPHLEPLADDVDQALQGAVATTRQAISWMQTASISPFPFAEALRGLAEEFADRFALKIEVSTTDVPPLDPSVEVELLRITQEALRNTVKHADAPTVSVALTMKGGWLEIAIHDNGRGFDLDRVPIGSFGLMTMNRRADVIGAKLEIVSRPGAGTRVRVRLRHEAPAAPATLEAVDVDAEDSRSHRRAADLENARAS